MTRPEQDTDRRPAPESMPTPQTLDDDVLDLILDAHVNEEVVDVVAETRVATIVRQQRCKCLQLVLWQFAVSRIWALAHRLESLGSKYVGRWGSIHVCPCTPIEH